MDVEQAMKDADNMGTGADDHAAIAERVWAGTRWHYPQIERMADLIRTLAAEVRRLSGAVPAGRVRDDNGVDVPFVGELVKTADGYIAGAKCELWADFTMPGTNIPQQCLGPGYPCVPMNRLYAQRAAAEAARERGGT